MKVDWNMPQLGGRPDCTCACAAKLERRKRKPAAQIFMFRLSLRNDR
jgi:hypothetical protein